MQSDQFLFSNILHITTEYLGIVPFWLRKYISVLDSEPDLLYPASLDLEKWVVLCSFTLARDRCIENLVFGRLLRTLTALKAHPNKLMMSR